MFFSIFKNKFWFSAWNYSPFGPKFQTRDGDLVNNTIYTIPEKRSKIVYSRTGSHSPAFAFTSIFRLLAFYLSSLLPQYDQYCFNPIESSIRRQLKLLDLVFVVYVQDHDNLLSFQSHTKSKLHSLQQIQIVVGQFFLHVKSTKRMTGPTVIPERYVRISMQRNVFKHLWIYFFSVPENQWMDYDCY